MQLLHPDPSVPAFLPVGLLVCATMVSVSDLKAQGQAPRVAAVAEHVVRARPLPLERVRLLGGPLKLAQDLDARYLLRLEPDRMLAYYRKAAGLEPRAEPYGGWDGGGRNLTGHVCGHYLSAVSLMWAATGDPRFRERAEYIVRELKAVQDENADGYLCALEGGRDAFARLAAGEIRSAAFDLNGQWAPWYTLHKLFAGLRDAWRYTGNRTALEIEVRLAAWAGRILSGLDDRQVQRMLGTEFGGMNEVLVDLYADTGDRRWLELSYRFEHEAFIEPLQRHQDNLAGKHGNTQVPKLIGSADRFGYTGNAGDLTAASFFWDRVVQHHSFATGGHGKDEYFGPPDMLSDRIDGRTAETCNVYNMLKLTRRLFSFRPDAHYADFLERALFNHVLASIDPQDGRTCYMVPVGRGVQREYQDMDRSFTCCVGSGMESHALHGDGIYYVADDRLWVNLYAPSTAEWTEAGVRLSVDTEFPEGEKATLAFAVEEPVTFTLALRRPHWAGDGFGVTVNGEDVPDREGAGPQESAAGPRRRYYEWSYPASTYLQIEREWSTGDTVRVFLPKSLRLEPLPDDPQRVAILWGPLVLAGDLGPERPRGRQGRRGAETIEVPVFVAAGEPVAEWLAPTGSVPVRFRSEGVGRLPGAEDRPATVELAPLYRLHRRTYCVYWDLYTPADWEARRAEYRAEAERLQRLEAATVAWVEPGDREAEREYGYRGEGVRIQRLQGRIGRRSSGWFEYELPVEADRPMVLLVTFYSDDRRGTPAAFEIRADGHLLSRQEMDRTDPPRFFDVELPIPTELIAGKESVTVRFQADAGSRVATVFGLRMVRGGR